MCSLDFRRKLQVLGNCWILISLKILALKPEILKWAARSLRLLSVALVSQIPSVICEKCDKEQIVKMILYFLHFLLQFSEQQVGVLTWESFSS